LGPKSQNRAVARFRSVPFKVMAGKGLGGCWGEVGEVQLRVWLSIWSRARGFWSWARILKPSCCGSFRGVPFNATAGKALRGCYGEVGVVRLWMRLSIWSRAGAFGLGPESRNRAVVACFRACHPKRQWEWCWGVAGVRWVRCGCGCGYPFNRAPGGLGFGPKS